MANEEILELQIRDNAGTAAAALTELATALSNVKNAIGKGLNIKGTVNGLEKLKNAVNNGLNEESLARFERLATVLEKLKSVGGLKITGLKNIANNLNASGMVGDVQNAAQDAIGAVGDAATTITDVAEQRTAESAAAMQNDLNRASSGITGILAGLRFCRLDCILPDDFSERSFCGLYVWRWALTCPDACGERERCGECGCLNENR